MTEESVSKEELNEELNKKLEWFNDTLYEFGVQQETRSNFSDYLIYTIFMAMAAAFNFTVAGAVLVGVLGFIFGAVLDKVIKERV